MTAVNIFNLGKLIKLYDLIVLRMAISSILTANLLAGTFSKVLQ